MTNGKEGVATEVIKYIAALAKIEAQIKELSADEKYLIRQTKAKPILSNLHHYLTTNQLSIPPKSLLGQAVSYTLNQWAKLLTYLKDGRIENNNYRAERAIKPFIIGRKGWMCADSVEGTHAAATIFSFVETCKYHQIEPYDWFRYVFEVLPSCQTLVECEKSLPFNIDRAFLKTNLD